MNDQRESACKALTDSVYMGGTQFGLTIIISIITVTCCLTTGTHSEKSIVKWFCCCAAITKYTYKDLEGTAYHTQGLSGIPPSYMQSIIDWNIVIWHITVLTCFP